MRILMDYKVVIFRQ